MPKNVKNDSGCGQEGQHKRPPVTCILHVSGIKYGKLTPFCQIKVPVADKLSYLQHIRDKRLSQSPDSTNPMEAVCKSIPDNLTCADLEAIGYRWACYQHFTKHQDQLQCYMVVSSTSHSPRKRPILWLPLIPRRMIWSTSWRTLLRRKKTMKMAMSCLFHNVCRYWLCIGALFIKFICIISEYFHILLARSMTIIN